MSWKFHTKPEFSRQAKVLQKRRRSFIKPRSVILSVDMLSKIHIGLSKIHISANKAFEREIKKINQEILKSTFKNFIKSLYLVIKSKGKNLSYKY